jgi:hypothetical protein
MAIESKYDKLFSLVPERACGDCIACCQIPRIDSPSLQKPANVICPNCTNPGCGSYDTRPDPCRAWHCLWRRLDSLSAQMRPDLAKIMLSLEFDSKPEHIFENAYLLGWSLEGLENSDYSAVNEVLIDLVSEFDLPLWVVFDGRRNLLYPAAELAQEIINPGSSESPAIAAEAKAWLAQYLERIEQLKSKAQTFRSKFVPLRLVSDA